MLGAEVSDILMAQTGLATPAPMKAPTPFPNADSPVKPVPGTRLEYTPVSDFYRVDIDLEPPSIDALSWRLKICGLVERPVSLTLDELKATLPVDRPVRHAVVHLQPGRRSADLDHPVDGSAISRRAGEVGVNPQAATPTCSPRTASTRSSTLPPSGRRAHRPGSHLEWEPLPTAHGFPLRLYRPGHYGMKQPKWITEIVLVPDDIAGYWVSRGWDARRS